MKQQALKLITVCIIIALFSGCATTGATSGAKNTKQKNEDKTQTNNKDSKRTKVEGTVFGAIIGGVLGGAIGYALERDKGLASGAAIGAALGAGAGYLGGSKVAKIKKQYANQEDCLDAQIKLAADYNEQLNTSNMETQNKISTLNDDITALKSSNQGYIAQMHEMKKKKDEINTLASKNSKTIDYMNKELVALQDYKQSVAQTQNAEKLEQEISTLQTNIAMLDQNNHQMAQLANSLSATR
jgi:outer membrane lipoprotein SlyB